MKKLIVMLIACGLLAGVSLTATVGCGDGKATTKATTKATEPVKATEPKVEEKKPEDKKPEDKKPE